MAALAAGLALIAGCGGGEPSPVRPVEQPEPVSSPLAGQTGSPGEVSAAVGVPGTLTPQQAAELDDQQAAGRRGFWTVGRPRPAFREWTIRETALDALTRIGEPAVPALVDLLDESNPQLRAEAVVALARIGPDARAALPRLIELVEKDPDDGVRKNAVRALGQIGPAAAPAVPVLVEQIRRADETPTGNTDPARGMPAEGR